MGAYEVGAQAPSGSIPVILSYAYDHLYRLTKALMSNGNAFTYTYDAVGNRLTMKWNAGTTMTYTYDVANRLVNSGGVTYTWDANGNLLYDGVITYTYDVANRPITMTEGVNTYTYKYTGLGDRRQQVVNGTPTTYTLDINSGLTQVLVDGVNIYLYGNGRIYQQTGGSAAYFLGDALGSVRQLVSSAGNVTLAKNYEAYGTVLSSAGSGVSMYGFTGEQTDNTGLVFLRARYYAPMQGRFISKDAWGGDYNRPQSLNTWLYAYGNPINHIDPTGLIPCTENQVSRFCVLTAGGFLDIAHFGETKRLAQSLLEIKLPAVIGKRFGEITLDQVFVKWRYGRRYYTAIPGDISHDDLVGVGLGIFLDFEIGYESAQGLDPRCVSNLGHPVTGLGHCSSFSNEDLPSDYLGFVSASTGLSFDDIVSILGGGEQLDQQNPPLEYWGSSYWLEPVRCGLGECGDYTPFNNQCTLKVYDAGTGRYSNRPWPSSLTLTPIGRGIYWGKSLSEFAVSGPTPPSSSSQSGTPIPFPQSTPRPPGN